MKCNKEKQNTMTNEELKYLKKALNYTKKLNFNKGLSNNQEEINKRVNRNVA